MTLEYLAEIEPERCVDYGPRLWIKFYHADIHGSICRLACHGGPDREYRYVNQAASDKDSQVILLFEFPRIVPLGSDTMETLAMRRRYHEACLTLLHAGYLQREGPQNEEFFCGYRDSIG